ncbi:MAG: 16S rRNA (adenine(1518)-N(6)/adenine(1519)-N(6))-dimethyltransferase RsmA [Leptotrichiaceae bacterium]|nr:16S rRNA (adenine(1518)-N(6)/adenine(1519)-N(6))-dimethyltransferase RsmA [Leptotrichiaceae bacterium]
MDRKKFEKKNKKENYDAKKKYGQNFLNDSELAYKILEAAKIEKNDEIIEIGPGLGFLTENLIEKAGYVTAFEIDSDLIPLLNKKFKNKENFLLVHKDFMEVNLEKFLENKKNVKVVANIPYYITSPIINKLLEFRKNISEIYLMVQKEVAERITSKPRSKNMSLLTHGVQFFAEAEYLFTVSREKFEPVPKVDSAFLKIVVLKNGIYEEQISEDEYFKYLKAAFSNKRKSIANNLTELGFIKETIGNILEKLGKTKLARTEEFSVQEFIDFVKMLKKEEIRNKAGE